ncbi:MAG: tetratricopeptide repeat protein [Myxococcaceae bacterium]
MQQVLIRAMALLKRPFVAGAALAIAVGGATLARIPLLRAPGFELAEVLTLALGVLGGGVGIAAAKQERRLLQGMGQRPVDARRLDDPLAAAWSASAASALLLVAATWVPIVVSILASLVSTPCDPWAKFGFVPWLTLPTLLLASAAGVCVGFLTRRAWTALLLYWALVVGSLVPTLWPLYFGPQVFAFNVFLGFFPGPIYDEVLELSGGLFASRLEATALAFFFVSLAGWWLDAKQGTLSRPSWRPVAAGCALLGLAAVGLIERRATALGLRTTYASLTTVLDGSRESEHFVIHYPRATPAEQVDRWVRDAEFRWHQIADRLKLTARDKRHLYFYASAEQKARWVGADRTQFAKPWQGSAHLNAGGTPHGTLRHELVHLLAAEWATGILKVPTAWGVFTAMPLVEGLAVAVDGPPGDVSLHRDVAAMRAAGLAPSLTHLFTGGNFYSAAGPRAYAAAGSFVRYLLDTYGHERLRSLYAKPRFAPAYGKHLKPLVEEWERFVDALPLTEKDVAHAAARFRQNSVFGRSCAREVASLEAQAYAALAHDTPLALRLFERCAAIDPQEPRFALGRAEALLRLGRTQEAAVDLAAWEQKLNAHPTLAAEVALVRADVELALHGAERAATVLDRALSRPAAPEVLRAAHIKRMALGQPKLMPVVRDFFNKEMPSELKLLALARARERMPREPALEYLYGRRLAALGAPRAASESLALAASTSLPDEVAEETHRLLVQSLYLAGDCLGVKDAAGRVPDIGRGLLPLVREYVERCEFEARTFQGHLTPPDPLGP